MRRILPKALFILLMIPALASCMGSRGSSWSEDGLDVATAITAQYRKISPPTGERDDGLHRSGTGG